MRIAHLLKITVYCLGVLVFSLLLLPVLFEYLLLPKVADRLPFTDAYIGVSKITPWQVSGTFRSSKGMERGGVEVPGFTIKYSIVDLLKGKISSILLDSASIHLRYDEDRVTFPGMDQQNNPAARSDTGQLELPAAVDRLIVRDSKIVIHEGSKTHLLVVDGNVELVYDGGKDGRNKVAGLKANISTYGLLSAQAKLTAVAEEDGYNVIVDAETSNISGIMSLLPQEAVEVEAGRVKLAAAVGIKGHSQITDYHINAQFEELKIVTGDMELGGANSGPGSPVELEVEGNTESAKILLAGASVIRPQRCKLDLAADYYLQNASVSGKAVLLPQLTDAPVALNFNGIRTEEETLINFHIEGEGFAKEEEIKVEGYSASGEVTIGNNQIHGKVNVSAPKIAFVKNELVLSGILMDIPFSFPQQEDAIPVPGNIFVDSVSYKDTDSARIKASTVIKGKRLAVNVLVTTPLNSEAQLSCSGSATISGDSFVKCHVPKFDFDSSTLPPYVRLPDDFSATGKAAGEVSLNYNGAVFQGIGKIHVEEGRVSYKQNQFSEIAFSLEFPELPALRTSPQQICTIGKVDLGKIKMTNAAISLRLDDKQTVFIEKAKLNWCGGRVETGAIRLHKGMQGIDTTLYCDRLGYTELLSQFGIGNAEGEGALNGRLPLTLGSGGVKFDDGFLFSTPGNSGIVRFRNTEQLRQGMPGVEKAAYLEYSLDALKNFSYNWTKLRFNSEGDDLLLSLQLDGKPAEPLPYGYKQGQIVKTNRGQGLQHPIRLDVNFRLPVDDLFRYGKSIQSFMENK